jgi:hypothetical protein
MLCEQFDHHLAACHVQRWLGGARPVTADGFPLIGGCLIDGLVFATGTHRDGFHCSPVTSSHIADTVLGSGTDDRFDCFTPERPPIEVMPTQQAIAEAVDHETDTRYEYGLTLPYWLDEDDVRFHVQQRVRQVYENLGTALLPEIVRIIRAAVDPTRTNFLRVYLRAARAHHTSHVPVPPARNATDSVPLQADG